MENLDIGKLQEMRISELNAMARKLGITGYSGLRKQELITRILEAKAENTNALSGSGVLEILHDRDQGYGFLRSSVTTTCKVMMTSMYLRHKFGGSIYAPAMRSQGRSVRPRRARTKRNATLLCCRLKQSTKKIPR